MWQSVLAVFERVLLNYVLVKQERTNPADAPFGKRYTFYYLERREDIGL